MEEKVFRKMGFQLTNNDTEAVINCMPEAIERVLKVLQVKLQLYLEQQKMQPMERKPQQPQQKQNKKMEGVPP